jgi:tetratricopeptide (TPR) repeat protein
LLSLSLAFLLLLGCDSRNHESPQQRYDAAKALFEQTTRNLHIPSVEAKGTEKQKLLEQAAIAYQQLLHKYPEQDYWAAQSLRSLGNIRAAQTNLNEAIKYYTAVDRKYPLHDFEVLMAWKAAADLLWEAGRWEEAKGFYQKLLTRFDRAQASQVVKAVIRGCRTRLANSNLPDEK